MLRVKYCKDDVIASSDGSSCSNTWRWFSLGARLLKKGMKWRVGNGDSIKFWTNAWVPNFSPLLVHAILPLSIEQVHENVADYLMSSEWKVHKLIGVLPWGVIQSILSIHVDINHGVPDKAIWGLSKNGDFSVRSAYELHFEKDDVPLWEWSFIWKLNLPPKVSHFLWILLHGKLLTNDHRAIEGLTMDISCDRCKAGCENVEHVFRGCNGVIDIWEDIWKGVSKNVLFNAEWKDWLLQNLKRNRIVINKWSNYLIFAVALWFIWKGRCEHVFNANFKLPTSLGKVILTYVVDWFSSTNTLDKGVFRDDNYNWLGGFAMNKGVGSAIEAEMSGIFEGKSLAWKAGYKKLVIETDSMSAVHLLNATLPQNHHLFSIAQACRNFMEEDWSCLICHGYRESNRVAGSLANLGHSLDLGTSVFERPPPRFPFFSMKI
ncbi:hypothetical protein Dsin_018433 [Dipteronia sinensis]|uniref:Reverse transcriptase zinc-binding domain-containing protein n=1 Tax=Dipteronia sinensis TaxID=43782 RepID=A0AAE0E1L6_9ROSI|nr:hypothetical protein Dsin_018433 [Dipteronia sinensis]